MLPTLKTIFDFVFRGVYTSVRHEQLACFHLSAALKYGLCAHILLLLPWTLSGTPQMWDGSCLPGSFRKYLSWTQHTEDAVLN